MIRFRATSSITNNNTFWIEGQYTGSVVQIALTSSFSLEKNSLFADVQSAKYNGNGSWILINTVGSQLPTSSGQYDLNIYGASTGVALTWGQASLRFSGVTQTWGDVEGSTGTNQFLSYDRAYISGSDYDTITNYNYQDKPEYSVYNG